LEFEVLPKRKLVPFDVFYYHAKFRTFRVIEVPFSYFTIQNQFDIRIIFGIFEKGLPGLVHRTRAALVHLKLTQSHPVWPGPRPT
jgi:hypothetical protein